MLKNYVLIIFSFQIITLKFVKLANFYISLKTHCLYLPSQKLSYFLLELVGNDNLLQGNLPFWPSRIVISSSGNMKNNIRP